MAARQSTAIASNNTNVVNLPTADEYIAEYLARKTASAGKPKRSLLNRLTGFVEDKAVDAVANSTRFAGRIMSAVDAAADGYEEAKVLEHKRQAQLAAQRLGLV